LQTTTAGHVGALRLPGGSLSEAFEDGLALLRVAEERGLEGVMSKRRDAPYWSGECRDWRRVKTAAAGSQQGALPAIRVVNASPHEPEVGP